MTRSSPVVLLVAALGLGCPSTDDDPGPARKPMKTAPGGPAPAAPASKTDVPFAEPGIDEAAGPFRVSAEADAMMQLHPLLSGEIYMSVGPKLVRLATDGRHRPNPNLLRGIVSFREPGPEAFAEVAQWQPVAVGGRFPDGFYLALQARTGFEREREVPDLYQWDHAHERWSVVNNRHEGYAWLPSEFHPWVQNSILCDRRLRPHFADQQNWDGPSDGPRHQQRKLSAEAIDGAKRLIVVRGPPKAPVFEDQLNQQVVAFDSLATGEIATALADGTVMLWSPSPGAAGTVTVESLPSTEGRTVSPSGVQFLAPGQVLVFGGERRGKSLTPYLATRDDGTWTQEETFDCRAPLVAYAQAQGHRWAICGSAPGAEGPDEAQAIWTAPPQGPWETVPLPADAGAPRDVVARRHNHVWVVTQPGAGPTSRLFHNGRVHEVVRYPGVAELADEVLQWSDPLSASQECSNVFATLDDDGVDTDAIAAAMKGKYPDAGRFTQLSLVRATFRGKTTAGLQLWAVESIPERGRILSKLERLVGSAALGTPYCYYADGTTLLKWSLGPEDEQ